MAQVEIKDFKFGLDRRRPRVAGVPGTLWTLTNAHISRGGDIERAKKFVPVFSLPDSTFGLVQRKGQLKVFGSIAPPTMPIGVEYGRLIDSAGTAMTRVNSNVVFGDYTHVIAQFAGGNVQSFYSTSNPITSSETLWAANADQKAIAARLARLVGADPAARTFSSGSVVVLTAKVAGAPFTVSASTVDGGGNNDQTAVVATPVANVVAVAEVRGAGAVTVTGGSAVAGANQITQIAVNGVSLLTAPIDWLASNNSTAATLAVKINNNSAAHGYSASTFGSVVTVRPPVGSGASRNGHVVVAVLKGNVTATTGDVAGGVTAVTPVAQTSTITLGGTYQGADRFSIVVNGTTYSSTGAGAGAADFGIAHKGRIYTTGGSFLFYCTLFDPATLIDANTSTGAGNINVASDGDGSEQFLSLAKYQTSVAVFSRTSIRIYDISANAANNNYKQDLANSGTYAPKSTTRYGNNDVFYLDEPGIRSIQSNSLSNIPTVADVGSPVDPSVKDWRKQIGDNAAELAVGTIEPSNSSFWLAMGSRVYVLSYFPASKIHAWSIYEPGTTFTDFVSIKGALYPRDANVIYAYGGLDGETYPSDNEQPVTIETPFISANTPATFKKWTGFDIACVGEWDVYLLVDPNDESKEIHVGKVVGNTLAEPDIGVVGEAPLVALRMVCTKGGFASVSKIVLHHTTTESG